ncbi:hypothetical protein KC316_g8381 [Hortaea werneckii]|nr:hypothetical protein KC324_g8328 [Hortaea werneckii]KAI7581538.1 hypothetical protein KC316_g8381 [Hortaea werneckii]
MCQICSIKQIATQDRWPKPLESAVQDINFLVQTIHTDYEANKPQRTTKETIPKISSRTCVCSPSRSSS